jgi:ATP synthase protein I
MATEDDAPPRVEHAGVESQAWQPGWYGRLVMADKQPPQRPDPGANAGWAALGTLLGGIVTWGGIGWLLDSWLKIPNHIGLLVGMIVGITVAMYVVMKRFG